MEAHPIVPASAEIPMYIERINASSFAELDAPKQGGIGHTLPFLGAQPAPIEHERAAIHSGVERLPSVADDDATFGDMLREQWAGILEDHAQFYSFEGLTWLTLGVGAGAVMANTEFDESFVRDEYKERILRAHTDEYAEAIGQPKFLGNGYYTIPVFAAAAIAGRLADEWPVGNATAEWGDRSLRTFLVGAPPMLALQVLTGGSRPGETTSTSHWKPFDDSNGVSGHSFMGAIPFVSAAKMTDNIWLKGGLYAVSVLPALSRVNDDAHYFSQAFLGWWLAYLAGSAVDRSHDPTRHHHFRVAPMGDGLGVAFDYAR